MIASYLSYGLGTLYRKLRGFPPKFSFEKKSLIDYLYTQCQPAPVSFADLGGVWGVDGAYTFYILRRYPTERAFLVDTDFTDKVIKRSREQGSLMLVGGNFGEASVAEQIGTVDAVILFDVLLHQVKPDWDEVLELYSGRTRYFVVYNQQWIPSEETLRLLDLGREEYLANVPHDEKDPLYTALFEKMYETHPQHQRIWRDIHNVWQWGITDRDLLRTMADLGYEMLHYVNFGGFRGLRNFENHAFVFRNLDTLGG